MIYSSPDRNEMRGIVLLEIILYTALAVMILSVTALLYVTVSISSAKQRAASEAERSGATALLSITQEIRDASGVIGPPGGSESGTLELSMKDAARDPALITLVDGSLILQEHELSALPLTAPEVVVDSLVFENLTPGGSGDSIRITVEAHYKNPGGRNELEYAATYHATANTR